jgi:hypothetical protein
MLSPVTTEGACAERPVLVLGSIGHPTLLHMLIEEIIIVVVLYNIPIATAATITNADALADTLESVLLLRLCSISVPNTVDKKEFSSFDWSSDREKYLKEETLYPGKLEKDRLSCSSKRVNSSSFKNILSRYRYKLNSGYSGFSLLTHTVRPL